jgi:DivIVA domain-containing protein
MNESNAQFRSVLRGYDTAQVDQHVSDLTRAAEAARREAGDLSIQVSKLEAAQRQLMSDIEAQAAKTRGLEEAQAKAAPPTYADLGQRIGAMLKLADEEGNDIRTRAKADAESHHALADESARATREGADIYAKETRSAADSEASRVLEDARRRADSILDDADRQATARREEAEAVYERARAKSAAAAADFETTLATRRDTSAQEFAVQIAAAEQQLAAVQQRSEKTRADSEQRLQEAATKSARQLAEAKAQAQAMVAEAKTKAERIRDDSERVLAAATQRRDSINSQLTNVRQMLATLSGGAMVNTAELTEAGSAQSDPAQPQPEGTAASQTDPAAAVADVKDGENAGSPAGEQDSGKGSEGASKQADGKQDGQQGDDKQDGKQGEDKHATDKGTGDKHAASRQSAGVKG